MLNKQDGVFGDEDERIATALGAQCAVALQRARLLEDLVAKEKMERELAVARAAKAKGVEQILSTVAAVAVEEVNAARGRPVWFQLYTSPLWRVTEAVVKRAEASGCPVLALTVDLPVSNREVLARHRRATNPECQACHAPGANFIPPKPIYDGIDLTGGEDRGGTFMDWDFVDRLRESTSMKLLLKGIVTAEDARLAVEHGASGIVVSNHGGRQLDTSIATIDALPAVVEAVNGRVPVLVDGGIRRGSDVLKALALGARAVMLGRPILWGLAVDGEAGVRQVLEILEREFDIAMALCGCVACDQVDRDLVVGAS